MIEYIDFHKDINWQDIIYNTPTKENIRKINSFLRNNRMNKFIRLYHATGKCNHKNIIEEGLKKTSNKTKKSLQSSNGYVYLSIYPSMAKEFAIIGYPFQEIIVYSVDIPIYKIKPDKDQLNNKRYWGEGLDNIGNTLGDSILYGHGVRVKEDIEPYRLTIYKEEDKLCKEVS